MPAKRVLTPLMRRRKKIRQVAFNRLTEHENKIFSSAYPGEKILIATAMEKGMHFPDPKKMARVSPKKIMLEIHRRTKKYGLKRTAFWAMLLSNSSLKDIYYGRIRKMVEQWGTTSLNPLYKPYVNDLVDIFQEVGVRSGATVAELDLLLKSGQVEPLIKKTYAGSVRKNHDFLEEFENQLDNVLELFLKELD